MNTFTRSLAAVATAVLCTASAWAAGPIVVEQPVARATAPGQPAGGGYLRMKNTGRADDRLVAVQADVSQTVKLHSMAMDGDVMRMREIDGIDLPAGKTVELQPGGLHVMFMGLKAPLKAGDSFPATLKFKQAGDVKVTVRVVAPTALPGSAAHHNRTQEGGHAHDHGHTH